MIAMIMTSMTIYLL